MESSRLTFGARWKGVLEQLIMAAITVGLAVGAVVWMAANAADSRPGQITSGQPTGSPSPSTISVPPLSALPSSPTEFGGILVLIVRDDVQALEAQAMVSAETRLRTLANEPPRSVSIVISPNSDIYRAILDDANLLPAGQDSASVTVIDLR
jgi:hypothetical protein